MAVVQISRIQIRRGQKNVGTGIPQLASGEMAWAIDTQELYIGNGAISEGSPAVGNTKILTEADNLLDLIGQYVYKADSALIQTGSDPNYPITRTLQERLDDRVTSAEYGILSNAGDQATAIQRAIDNLFITNKVNGASDRVTLEFAPGVYEFSTTIYIPSYATIVGAGKQKTIFNFTGPVGTAFSFVDDTSTVTNKVLSSTSNSGSTTEYNIQPKFCVLKGFTVNTNEPDVQAMQLDCVRDSVFEDIELTGSYGDSAGDSTLPGAGYGIGMYALSSIVTCQRNKFIRVTCDGFKDAVFAKEDIFNNTWTDCEFLNSRFGFEFGVGADTVSTGEVYGPRKNIIENCYFYNIDRYGIVIDNGYGNKSRGNTFVNVGNEGGGNTNNVYSQIKFTAKGNTSLQDNFDRQLDLSVDDLVNDYLNEVEGKAFFINSEVNTVSLVSPATYEITAFRIPFSGDTGFKINYTLKSSAYSQMRQGTMNIAVDGTNLTLQFVDDYEYTGTAGQDTRVEFSAIILNGCVEVQYVNDNTNGTTTLTYSYSTIS